MQEASNALESSLIAGKIINDDNDDDGDNNDESELINSFFLPGGILDPEGITGTEQHNAASSSNSNPPPRGDPFYLPPVQEQIMSWKRAPPVQPASPESTPLPLPADLLLPQNRTSQQQSFESSSSDSIFGNFAQHHATGLGGLSTGSTSNEIKERNWLNQGSSNGQLQTGLSLPGFHSQHSQSSAQSAVSSNSNNDSFFGTPLIHKPPIHHLGRENDSGFSLASSTYTNDNAGTIARKTPIQQLSSNTTTLPPPGFGAISPDPATHSTTEPILSTSSPGEHSVKHFQKKPRKNGKLERSRASEGNIEANNVRTKPEKPASVNQPHDAEHHNSARLDEPWHCAKSRNRMNEKSSKRFSTPQREVPESDNVRQEERQEAMNGGTQAAVDAFVHEESESSVPEPASFTSSLADSSNVIKDDSKIVLIESTEKTATTEGAQQSTAAETVVKNQVPRVAKQPTEPSKKSFVKTPPRATHKQRAKLSNAQGILSSDEHTTISRPTQFLNESPTSSFAPFLKSIDASYRWMTEIFFPAVKQTFLSVTLMSSGLPKAIKIIGMAIYYVVSYANQDLQTYNIRELVTLGFFQIPTFNQLLMTNFCLPQFTPHIVSYTFLFFLCWPRALVSASCASPSSGSLFGSGAGGKRRKDRPSTDFAHHCCRTTLECLQMSLPFVCILEGFEKPEPAFMRLSWGERIVLFNFLRILRESLIISPIAWVALFLQCIITWLGNPGSLWLDILVVQSSMAIGMAAVRLIRKRAGLGSELHT